MLEESLPEEVQLLRKVVRDVAQRRIAPLVRDIDDGGTFSFDLLAILREAGFLSMAVPPAYGGVDSDLRSYVVIMEELGKVFPTACTTLTPHWFATKVIARAATGDWVAPFLAEVAGGEHLGAIALTEPNAGSDLAAASTRARQVDGSWVIDGQKRFITNGGVADFYLVLARTGGDGPGGLSLFFVEGDRPGMTVGRFEKKMGLRSSPTAELYFDGVAVPQDHLVGDAGRGFAETMQGMEEGRIMVAALSLGIAQGALEQAVAYAAERQQFGKPIAAFQGLQFLIADMGIRTEAARSLTYDAAEAYLAGRPDAARLAAMAKTFASDAAMAVTTDAVQVLGGSGYVTDFPVEMLMRDAKINQIFEGTNQIQRMLIARSLLGPAARG
jgi:alkylation response protein AidB-like acyl-CoA dehydrogenase